jgi:hypothetical protein
MNREIFFDRYGILHHIPPIDGDPETSENGPMFYGVYITEKKDLTEDEAWKFLASIGFLYDAAAESWINTPISPVDAGFSHDNFKGMVAGILTCKRKFKTNREMVKICNGLLKNVPLFHPQLDHPRDFVWIGYVKYPYLFFPFLWIASIAFIVSCWQSYKYRHGIQIVKTDGKILARVSCKSTNMRITFWLCDLALKRWRDGLSPQGTVGKWKWLSWFQVYAYYFKDTRQPILSEVWE